MMILSTESGVLPAAESAMIVTGLLGYCCACAGVAAMASNASHAVPRRCNDSRIVIRLQSDRAVKARLCNKRARTEPSGTIRQFNLVGKCKFESKLPQRMGRPAQEETFAIPVSA